MSGVDEPYYVQLLSLLDRAQCWSQQSRDAYSVDFFYPDNVRHSTVGSVSSADNVTIRKRVVATLTFACPERAYDVRFRLSEEAPVNDIPNSDSFHLVRLKKRDSFMTASSDLRYDITVVQSGADKEVAAMNAESKVFEVEVELMRGGLASINTAACLFVKFPQLL